MANRSAPVLICLILVASAVVAASGEATAKSDVAVPLAKDSPEFVQLLQGVADEIDGQNVYDCIADFEADPEAHYRVMGTPSQLRFIEKYKNALTEVSPRIKSQVVHFEEGGAGIGANLPTGGNNIIGVLPGKDLTKWVVMGGHYDTREETVGGAAIDNTSGICTVKELARATTALDLQPEATMVFAWWDGEEWGLFGSRAFVKDHSATKELLGLKKDTEVEILLGQSYDIVGINYPANNMWVGYGARENLNEKAVLNLRLPPTGADNFTLCPSYGCYTKLQDRDDFDVVLRKFQNYSALVKEINYGLFELPPEWVQAWDDKYGRSDHVPFTAAGIPGMRIQGSHDGEWRDYHHASDTLAGAITHTGSAEALVAGFNQAADSGGTVALYVALKGELGTYAVTLPDIDGVKLPVETPELPGLELGVLLGALAVIAVLRRRTV